MEHRPVWQIRAIGAHRGAVAKARAEADEAYQKACAEAIKSAAPIYSELFEALGVDGYPSFGLVPGQTPIRQNVRALVDGVVFALAITGYNQYTLRILDTTDPAAPLPPDHGYRFMTTVEDLGEGLEWLEQRRATRQ